DIPADVQAIYAKAQADWGVEEWRTLALYLFDEFRSATEEQHHAIALVELFQSIAKESLRIAEKHASTRKFMRRLNDALKSVRVPIKPLKRPGRPKKLRGTSRAIAERDALLTLARDIGSVLAANQKAGEQLEAKGEQLPHNRVRFKGYVKTWKNKISAARRDLISHEAQPSSPCEPPVAYCAGIQTTGDGCGDEHGAVSARHVHAGVQRSVRH
ncbi:MAG: hypothetical protein ACRDGM_13750, partial [bacterium]